MTAAAVRVLRKSSTQLSLFRDQESQQLQQLCLKQSSIISWHADSGKRDGGQTYKFRICQLANINLTSILISPLNRVLTLQITNYETSSIRFLFWWDMPKWVTSKTHLAETGQTTDFNNLYHLGLQK